MKIPASLREKINLEPLNELYYEFKTFWLVHPERVKRIVSISGPGGPENSQQVKGKVAFVRASALKGATLADLAAVCGEVISRAKASGAGLVVFSPEAGDLLLQLAPYKSPRVFRQVQEAFHSFWSSLAAKYHLWLIPGYRELHAKRRHKRVAFIYDPEGQGDYQTQVQYTKEELAQGFEPARSIKVWQTGAGPISLSFPGEEQFFEIGRVMAAKGAKIVVSLAAWNRPFEVSDVSGGWARAQENNFYWLTSSLTLSPVGASIDGSGVLAHPIREGEDLVLVQVNLDRLAEMANEDSRGQVKMRKEFLKRYLPTLY